MKSPQFDLVVRFQARGKKFEEVFACEAYAFVDYTVALRYGIR